MKQNVDYRGKFTTVRNIFNFSGNELLFQGDQISLIFYHVQQLPLVN